MKRLLSVASVAPMLLLSFSNSHTAGPFDGEWSGSATPTTGRCKPAIVTLTILGKVVTGRATFEGVLFWPHSMENCRTGESVSPNFTLRAR
jgi:hypothetical protein